MMMMDDDDNDDDDDESGKKKKQAKHHLEVECDCKLDREGLSRGIATNQLQGNSKLRGFIATI